MEKIVSATEARIHFGELMQEAVESHKPIIVERGGKSYVVVLSVDEYERLVAGQQQDDWRELVRQAHAQIRVDLKGRDLPAPEELLERVREERDEQLLVVH